MQEIRLGSTDSVFSTDRENTIHINLEQSAKKIPLTNLSTVIDQYEVYRSEASACNKYRLTLTIKPYCTNVLFNTCTEIVKDDGSDEMKVVRDNAPVTITDPAMKKNISGLVNSVKRAYMVDNTEYSSENVGFTYYPGYDIFGNHILRNLSFRSIIPLADNIHSNTYNTIEDTMRTLDGTTIKMVPRFSSSDTSFVDKHVYETTNILSMANGESVAANLTNENGWYGFYNNSCITPKRINGTDKIERDSNHAVNNKGNCEFVDMYPDRSLYSFTPKLNKYKHRLEHNWDVFVTYPYKNFYRHNLVTNVYSYDVESQQIDFDDVEADGNTNALLIMEAKSQYCRNGMKGVQFRTYCKHNLKQNDYVLIYYSLGDGGDGSFRVCNGTFRVNYVGDMNNEYKDYYFTITNSSILDEIFDGRVAHTFYDGPSNVPPSHFREMNGEITEIPDDIDTSDTSYEPNICRWFYKQMTYQPTVTWDNQNTVDTLPADVKNGLVYVRQRKIVSGEYIYHYYHYQNNEYQILPETFDILSQEFGDGNTFDDIPVGYVTDYIRVHTYDYYEKSYEYYTQKTSKVDDIINERLCYRIPLRFAKIVNGTKCKYYIRMFKKLPNLNKSIENLTNSIAINQNRFDEYVQRNATKDGIKMRDFDREVYPLAFSKTIYGDNITQYQFMETMDIAYIRDNLGRPLTNLYITIVKKNVGYKEWYGSVKHYSDYIENNQLKRVEYSHCFGKVTSGLDFMCREGDDTEVVRKNKGFLSDAKVITNVFSETSGQPLEFWGMVNMINNNQDTDGILEDDEIFFGDVVEYNPTQVLETTLSDVQFRFNTAQRENGDTNDYTFTYKEVISDDYSQRGFNTEEHTNERSLICPEGYYYKAHYPIGVRSFANNVKQASHYSVLLDHAEPVQMEGMFIRVVTRNTHGYGAGRTAFICNDSDGVWYETQIVYVDSKTSFIIKPIRKDVEAYENKPYLDWIQTCNLLNNETFRIRVANLDIPDYADNVSTNLFLWREVIPASESNDETISNYPFANGALYIDKCINFYLKRQDPDAINGLYYYGTFPDVQGKIKVPSNYEYIPEIEVTC